MLQQHYRFSFESLEKCELQFQDRVLSTAELALALLSPHIRKFSILYSTLSAYCKGLYMLGEQPVFYILDEVAGAMISGDEPNLSSGVLFHVPEGFAYTIFWPTSDLLEGDALITSPPPPLHSALGLPEASAGNIRISLHNTISN